MTVGVDIRYTRTAELLPHTILVAYDSNVDQAIEALPAPLKAQAADLQSTITEEEANKLVVKRIVGVKDAKEHSFHLLLLPSTATRNLPEANYGSLQAKLPGLLPKEDCTLYVTPLKSQHIDGLVASIAKLFPLFNEKTTNTDHKQTLNIQILADKTWDDARIERSQALTQAVRQCAELIDTPPNVLNPTRYVEIIRQSVEGLANVSLEVFEGETLREMGCGGIYNVGQCSVNPPAMCILRYKNDSAKENVAIVGKGVCYDTGGLSLKPREAMTTMKGDMAGSAAVLQFFLLAAKLQLPLNLDVAICIAENSVGAKAYRPDDIITMYSGKTVEVNNTDAEGRLLLADGLAWMTKNTKPQILLDMATLTGAQLIATGKLHAGIVTPDKGLEDRILAASLNSGDLAFPMIYAPEILNDELKSDVADMKNTSRDRMNAQSSAAGHFLEAHLGDFEGLWAHIDIAGPAWAGERGTGYGVALLLDLLAPHSA